MWSSQVYPGVGSWLLVHGHSGAVPDWSSCLALENAYLECVCTCLTSHLAPASVKSAPAQHLSMAAELEDSGDSVTSGVVMLDFIYVGIHL